MHEFTGEQLHYHAAKASFPANVLAAELLALRKQLEAAHDFNAELNEQVDGMIDDCDTIQAKYDRLREACQPFTEFFIEVSDEFGYTDCMTCDHNNGGKTDYSDPPEDQHDDNCKVLILRRMLAEEGNDGTKTAV